jgi:dipeptidyl aminopeptidase/acylaminoacyl peptidase
VEGTVAMTTTDVHIPHGDTILAGTLHLPAGPEPRPAIAMLQGSGADDRDAWGYFPPIREAFLDAGLAVLSWDKPGIRDSTGDWHDQTFFDRADEAMAALSWLRRHPGIDAARTGVWGHSQGGWIAQIVAGSDPKLAFAIINSGPGVDVEAQDLYGIEHTLRDAGGSEADVRRARAYMARLHAAARAGMPRDVFVRDVLEPARGTPGFDYFGEVDAGMWGFLMRNLARPYDPAASLERIRCPVLAIFGERDPLVPVAESVRIFEEALARSGNDDVTIQVFPGADHRIRAGDPNGFADGYLETMATWLRERVR